MLLKKKKKKKKKKSNSSDQSKGVERGIVEDVERSKGNDGNEG